MKWCGECAGFTENRDGPLYRRVCDNCGIDRDN